MDLDNLLTREQLAQKLQVTAEAVRMMEKRKKIPRIKLGRVIRFDPIEVAKALEKKIQKANQ